MRTIADNLDKLKLRELIDICFRLGVDHPDGRDTRACWQPLAEEALARLTPGKLRMALLETEWASLPVGQPAEEEAPGTMRFRYALLNGDMEGTFAFESLRRLGLAWKEGRYAYLTPLACQAADMEDYEDVKAASVMLAVDGLLRIVGGMPLDRIGSCLYLPGQKGEEDVPAEGLQYLAAEIWRLRMGMNGIHRVNGNTWLTSDGCERVEELAAAHLVGKGRKLDYPRVAVPWATYVSLFRNPVSQEACKPVLDIMWRCGMDREEAHAILARTALLTQQGHQEEAIQLLSDALEQNPNPTQMLRISEFFEAVPLWNLKGHTEADLRDEPPLPIPGPGRGGLCTCGSGKLYIRCCGRLN